jgi:hypothetical protein
VLRFFHATQQLLLATSEQVLFACLLLNQLALIDVTADEKFKYRDRKVEFDSFKDLFEQKGVGLLMTLSVGCSRQN